MRGPPWVPVNVTMRHGAARAIDPPVPNQAPATSAATTLEHAFISSLLGKWPVSFRTAILPNSFIKVLPIDS